MRRAAVAFALLTLAVRLYGQEVPAVLSGPAILALAKASVVPLQGELINGSLVTYCSAVVLTPISVLVAEHCTRPDEARKRLWVDGIPVVWVSPPSTGLQVARAAIPGRAWLPIHVRKDRLYEGETVYGMGFAFGDSHVTITRGIVAHTRAFEEDRGHESLEHETWFDLTLIPGMSGGAIVDEYGRLVSVNQGLYAASLGSSLSHGPQLSAVQAIIKRHR